MKPSRSRASFIYIILIMVILYSVASNLNAAANQEDVLTLGDIAAEIQAGKIDRITKEGDRLLIEYNNSDIEDVIIYKEPQDTLLAQLRDLGLTSEELSAANVHLEVKAPSPWLNIATIATYLLPLLVLGGLFWFMFRQAQGSNNAAMSFGKSKARMFTGDQPTVTFDDIAGIEEAKEGLLEIVEFLQEPEKFIKLGARIPTGVLLVGAPGTGKTLLAKATSGEAGVPFFSISGSEFVEMFVGVGASRVRDLFEQAKKHSPCIIFIDEIDAVGRQRGAGLGGSHDEREQTLNQMLVEMDGFDTDTNIIILAATNRPDILDPALLRPGRFDRRVMLDRPDIRGREAILNIHVRGKPLEPDVDLEVIARGTPGFVGADLENLVNEAAILAARADKKMIAQEDFQESIERVMAGPERKSRLISEAEKRIIAYHEAGHAVVGHALVHTDPIHKVTIVPRGSAGGYVLALPIEETTLISRNKLLADMAFTLGGRAAEALVFDDITSGASNDLEQVTKMARQMVTRLGMSEGLGHRVYGKKDELIFLGREISEQRDYSDAVAEQIDVEVKKVIEDAYKVAKATVKKYHKQLVAIAEKLIDVETLTRDEFEKIFPSPIKKRSGTPVMVGVNGK